MLIRGSLLLFLVLCHSRGAETGLARPVLGFFFDPANGLQPIQGIAGALTIGTPLELTPTLTAALVSPRQDYALATAAGNSGLLRVMFGGQVSVEPLGIPIAGSDLVAISPTGSAAAFYDRARNRVQVVAGLPAAPALAQEFDLSAIPGVLESLAVSDGADAVLAGFSGVEQGAAVAFGSDGSVTVLSALRRATAARFLARSRSVVIADGLSSELYLVRDITGVAEATLLANAAQGLREPVAVAVSKDGKRAFVANSGSRDVAAIDLASTGITITSCLCSPSQLTPLDGNAVFRLTEPSAGPMWLFDGDAGEPRIVFVPPYRPAGEEAIQ
jgi:hypothetical protein